MLGDLHEAAEVYEHGTFIRCSGAVPLMTCIAVISADDTQNEVKMSLAEIYEVLNEPRKALKLVYEGQFYRLYRAPHRTTVLSFSHRLAQTETARGGGVCPGLRIASGLAV